MTPITINTDSISYRLATTYGPAHKWCMPDDICGYRSAVLKGAFVYALWFTALSLAAVSFGDLLGALAAMVATGTWIKVDPTSIGALVIIMTVGSLGIVLLGFGLWAAYRKRIAVVIIPPAVRAMYASMVDKFFVPVTYVDKDDVI